MKRLAAIVTLIIGFLTYSNSKAEETQFTASVNRSTVGLNDQFQLTFSLNSSGKNFQAPSLNDFSVLMGPSSSTSMQIINGTVTQSISYTYVLQPKTEGSFKIGPATVEAGGKKYTSNAITIKVVKGSSKSSEPQSEGESEDFLKQLGKNLFIKVLYNKNLLFQGEALSVTYKLYFRVKVVDFTPSKTPSLTGFWSQEVKATEGTSTEIIDGIEFNTVELNKTILFPQHSGVLELDPFEGDAVVRVPLKRKGRSNDPFEDFFNDPFFGGGRYQDIKYRVKSEAIKINVKPLPANAPASFSGGVGKFSMVAALDKSKTVTNESVNLKIKISGKGNLKLIDPIKLEFPPDIESYDPKVTDDFNADQSGLSGTRTLEYLLIPRHSGTYKINAFEFTYFDPAKGSYVTLKKPEMVLAVEKGTGNETYNSDLNGIDKEDVKLLGKDIRFIKTGSIIMRKKGDYFFGSNLFYSLLFSPLIFLMGVFIFTKRSRKLKSDLLILRSRKANKPAFKRLSQARKHLKQNNREQLYEEILKAIWGYLSDKLLIPKAKLTKESVKNALEKRMVKQENITKLLEILDQCEMARYAPSATSAEMTGIYKDAYRSISQLDQQLK